MRRTAASAVLAVALAGCGHGTVSAGTASPSPSPSPIPSPSPLVGSAAYLADIRAARFGDRDVAAESDESLLSFGNLVCSSLTVDHLSYGLETQVILTTQKGVTAAQADTVIRSAVNNLCPSARDQLP